MNEERRSQIRVEEFLKQDAVVSSFNFEEFRMNLEESIRKLEEQAQFVHRAALSSLAVFVACVLAGPLLGSFLNQQDDAGTFWILWVWSGCGMVALFVTFVLAAIDHYKFKPALKRIKSDRVWIAIEQLQLEVAEIKERLK